ncbi:MAG: acetyltransferase [Oligoflexia bacterium]|nr:acetyltransferase [Oligoflexia bacterium]
MLKILGEKNIQSPFNSTSYTIFFDGKNCRVESYAEKTLSFQVLEHENELELVFSNEKVENYENKLYVALDYLFSHLSSIDHFVCYEKNILSFFSGFPICKETQKISISRLGFYQLPNIWTKNKKNGPEIWISTNDKKHPYRPLQETGVVYKRTIPQIKKTISFRLANIAQDLDCFYQWHNQARVYDLWELNKPKEELREYLEKGLRDTHQMPLFLEVDGESVGYFEVYWAAEDRIAPYYDVEPFDRGFHFLIGNEKFLGRENTDQFIRSIMHFIFLDDQRTRRIVAEPRSDNKRVIRYVEIVPGWKFIKEFDFPHKRAALLMAKREDFFVKGSI